MEKPQSFLDILKEGINELLQKGIITEQQLKKGVLVNKEWLRPNANNKALKRKDIFDAMFMGMFKDEKAKETYKSHCEYKHKNPKKISQIKLLIRNEQLELACVGGDEWRMIIITTNKDETLKIQQKTPEEFLTNLYIASFKNRRSQKRDTIPQQYKTLQSVKQIKEDQRNGMNEIARNIISQINRAKATKMVNTEVGAKNNEFFGSVVGYRNYDEKPTPEGQSSRSITREKGKTISRD